MAAAKAAVDGGSYENGVHCRSFPEPSARAGSSPKASFRPEEPAIMKSHDPQQTKSDPPGRSSATVYLIVIALAVLASPAVSASASTSVLDEARMLFYNGRYAAADALTRPLCAPDLASLPACELLSSTVLFEIKSLVGKQSDRKKAWANCAVCPDLMSVFRATTSTGQTVARARLRVEPTDEGTRFLLGKLDLNYVWLQLGTLGHRTGWSEYWEARRSLDMVLEQNPHNVRARVARAWIDYIVDTQMRRGTRWVLGGGNRKRGLLAVREAADADGDLFVRAEARFALWDMQVREGNITGAIHTARDLARGFPDNQELRAFLAAHEATIHD